MKVLVDSCVWSLLLRRRNTSPPTQDQQLALASLKDAIGDGSVVIIGAIRQEILSGVKESAQFERLRTALEAFTDEPLETFDFEQAARMFNACRRRGVECGSIDILICSVATQRHYSILTCDRGLKRCMEILRSERMMS